MHNEAAELVSTTVIYTHNSLSLFASLLKEYYLESVAECDTPTAYDDVDFDNLSQDLSNKSVKSEFKITPDPPYIVPEIKI